jgi:hypothetical protein
MNNKPTKNLSWPNDNNDAVPKKIFVSEWIAVG